MKTITRCVAALAIQLFAVFLSALLIAFTRPVPLVYGVLIWLVLPIIGALSSCVCTVKGVNAFIAWIMPPLGATAAGFLASLGFSPDAGPIFLLAFVSLVGAAAGDVLMKQRAKGGKHK